MKTEPNHPSNPLPANTAISDCFSGLSKREYFAAKAMQGYVSEMTDGISHEALAIWSVKMADALINALNNK